MRELERDRKRLDKILPNIYVSIFNRIIIKQRTINANGKQALSIFQIFNRTLYFFRTIHRISQNVILNRWWLMMLTLFDFFFRISKILFNETYNVNNLMNKQNWLAFLFVTVGRYLVIIWKYAVSFGCSDFRSFSERSFWHINFFGGRGMGGGKDNTDHTQHTKSVTNCHV